MRTRFTSYEKDETSLAVHDIVELQDHGLNRKAVRRRIMLQLGLLVDNMLDEDYGVSTFTVEREA